MKKGYGRAKQHMPSLYNHFLVLLCKATLITHLLQYQDTYKNDLGNLEASYYLL